MSIKSILSNKQETNMHDFRNHLTSDEGYKTNIYDLGKVKQLRDLLAKKHEDSGEVFLINEGTYGPCEDEFTCMFVMKRHDGDVERLCPCCGEVFEEYNVEVDVASYEGTEIEQGGFGADFDASLTCSNCDALLKSTYEEAYFHFKDLSEDEEVIVTYFNDSPNSSICFNLEDIEKYELQGPLAMSLRIDFEASIREDESMADGYFPFQASLLSLPDRWMNDIDYLLEKHA